MTANTNAGSIPRTAGEVSLSQKSTESVLCAICRARSADGVNADGRPLCQPCAAYASTIAHDGGHTTREFEAAKTHTRNIINSFAGVDEANVTVRHNREDLFVDTVEGMNLPAGLLAQIERRAGLRFCAVEPSTTGTDGVRARFQFDDTTVLDRLAGEFQRRFEQAADAKAAYEQRDDEHNAGVEHGRTLAYQDAHSAVRAAQRGESDD